MDPLTYPLAIIIMVGLVTLGVINFTHRKREKKLLRLLNRHADSLDGRITRYDRFNHGIIGLSETSPVVILLRKHKRRHIITDVDLRLVRHCRLYHDTSYNPVSGYSTTQLIQLRLTYEDQGQEDTVLDLYNLEFDGFVLTGEQQLAEKWNTIIKEQIRKLNST